MTKTKLFFDGTPLIGKYVSGVGKVLQETLRALDTNERAMRYDMYIFLPFDEKGKVDKFGYKYIKVKYLPYPHKFLSLFSRMRIAPPIDMFLGKGVYVFENFRNWNLLFSKSITYIHDVAFKVYPEFVEDRNLAYLNKYIDLWIARSDAIVTVSEASKRDLKDKLGVVGVEVIQNGVCGDQFSPRSEQEVVSVREKWDIPKSYYLFIGNIEPRKNLENTIEAFMKTGDLSTSLVLIGGGGWRNEAILEKAQVASEVGYRVIRPNGYVPDEDLPALLSGAKALVHFPWYEGSGLPLLQAIACGTPVASSDIAPLKEVVSGLESMAIFANPADIDAMATAMIKASKKAHLEKTIMPISWASSADKLIDIVESL